MVDRGALEDCLSQTSKIAAECNTFLRDLLKGRSPQFQDLQRLADQVGERFVVDVCGTCSSAVGNDCLDHHGC